MREHGRGWLAESLPQSPSLVLLLSPSSSPSCTLFFSSQDLAWRAPSLFSFILLMLLLLIIQAQRSNNIDLAKVLSSGRDFCCHRGLADPEQRLWFD